MFDVQKLRFDEPLPHRTSEHESQESQSVEDGQVPPVNRLNGEVTRLGEIAFAGGTYCEIWQGKWETDKDKGDGEKVRLSLTVCILLTWLLVGVLENTSNAQVIREGAEGSTAVGRLCAACSCLLPGH